MSRKNAYRLLNPYIEGSIDTVVRAKNSFNAGKKLYNTISNFFTNHVEDFYMTVQNVETKELSHFRINENRTNNGTVDYDLVKLEEKFSPELEKKLVNNVDQIVKQSGGKHRYNDDDDESSSDSSSSDDLFDDYPLQPILCFIVKVNFIRLG